MFSGGKDKNMKIIKHGNKLVLRRFLCRKCGCEFEADYDEYFKIWEEMIPIFECDCPECRAVAREKEDVTETDQPDDDTNL